MDRASIEVVEFLIKTGQTVSNKLNVDKFLTVLMLLLVTVNVIFLCGYVFGDYRNYFHSDSAAKVLIAREIFDTGNFFPKDWNYVNGDLFVIFGHLFVIPLLAFMPAGFTAHSISGVIFAVLILHGIWLITSLANLPTWRRLAVVAVVASGISGFMAENLFGQVSYGVAILLCCYLIFISSQYIASQGARKKIWAFLLVGLMVLVYWANPKRAIVTYTLPLTGALIWLILTSDAQNRSRFLKLLALSFVGALGGSALHAWTIADVNNVSGASDAHWLSYELVLRNISLSLKGLYAQLGGLPLAGSSLFSPGGLYAGLRFVVACFVVVMTPIAIRRIMNDQKDQTKILALFAAFSLLLALFLQFTTSIADMSDPIQSSRYLVPGVILCLIVLLVSTHRWGRQPIWGISLALVTIVYLSSAYSTYKLSGVNSEQNLAQPNQVNSERYKLVAFLEGKGLQYGYASYWNAGTLSVLSDEKIRVRQIQFHNGLPVPMRHLSSNRWYRPAAWTGKTFLLLQENEVSFLNWQKLAHMGVTPIGNYRSDGFVIFVFAENIARHLTGWDTRYEAPTKFLPFAGVLSQTGRLVQSDSGLGPMLVAERGESGALHYGPYVNVEAGRYRVSFDVRADRQSVPVVRLDVAAAPDQKILGELLLEGSDKPQEIVFSLNENRTLEFRVWALGAGQVVFRGVSLVRIEDQK